MSVPPTVDPYVPRFNLRAFMPETDRRFFLLIFAILSSSLYIFSSEIVSLPLFPVGSEYTRCINQSFPPVSANTGAIGTLFYQCSALPARQEILWLLALELLVLGVAGLIYYWFLPAWIFRQKQLDPLPEKEFAKVRTYLENLREECKINICLQYVWNSNRSISPLVFGRRGRYYFFLPYGFLNVFSSGQMKIFRAIALHEIAHLRNKDVNKAYFAQSIWYSFIGIALLSFCGFSILALSSNFAAGSVFIFNEFIRILIMFAFVYLIRAAVLRSREVYADIEAAQWDGSPENIELAVGKLRPGRLFRWLEVHPHPDERKVYIKETQRVFRLKFWEAIGVGIAFGMAYLSLHDTFTTIGQLLSDWGLGMFFSPTYPDLGTLLLCLLVVLIIGQMIWHAALVARLQDRELSGTGWIGLCLAVGLVLGFFLSVYFTPLAVFYNVTPQILLVYFAPWVLSLVLGLAGFCKWLGLVASIWLEVVNNQRFFRIISGLSFVVASLILAVGFALFLQFLILTLGYLLPGHVNLTILTHLIFLKPLADLDFYWRLILQNFFVISLQRYYLCFTFIGLWALPLSSWFWYRKKRKRSTLQWALAGSPVQREEPPDLSNPFRLRAVILITLVGSILVYGPLVYIRFQELLYLRLGLAGLAVIGDGGNAMLVGPLLLSVDIWPYALAALAQACITAIIVLRVGRTGIISGLFGAFLGGILIVAGTIAIFSLLEGIGDNQYRFIFLYEVNWGAICALGIAMLIGMLRPGPHAQLKRHLLVSIPCILLICAIIFLPSLVMSLSNNQHKAATNIVQDGDFEVPIVVTDVSEQYTTGQFFGNWVVGSGEIELMGTRQVPAHGAQSVDLSSAGATMYQDLSTKSGANYSLSFAMAGDTECVTPAIKQLQVWWGGSVLVATLSFDIAGYMPTYMGWQYHTYEVHATTALTRLSFISLTPSACGPAIDGVTVKG